ncbi:7332_t:CDS:2 [Scutellospora calospora]|uniref:7332_t:CDS:1 n=1 Tax=Scutellospora calospora TaxID=85575 RepID=A0ACA9LK05_9GLOM|nr:7332_t:CDS:2 [Scutellospora calospora]
MPDYRHRLPHYRETLRRSRTSYSTFQTALFYLFRIKPKIASISQYTKQTSEYNSVTNRCSGQNNDPATCGRRIFLASLIVASKYLQDRNYSNRAWSKISGLPVNEVNANEICFLKLINYNLFISEDIFKRWSSLLLKHIQAISGPDISSPDAFRRVENQKGVNLFCETLRSMDPMAMESKKFNLESYPITPAVSTSGSPCKQQFYAVKCPISSSLIEEIEDNSINTHESKLKRIHSSSKCFDIDHFLEKQYVSSPISTFGNNRALANDCNETKLERCQNVMVRALA